MRLTVVGRGPAAPQPDTPASGSLVESRRTALLVDCGPGVVNRLSRLRDPHSLSAIVITHAHFDHFLDLVPFRYLLPWEGAVGPRPRIWLPPGGAARLAALAPAVSERPTFFQEAFDAAEYDPEAGLAVGDLQLTFHLARHYIPAWGITVTDASGARIVFSADTGPSRELVEAAYDADLLVCEATLDSPAEDDAERGHLTPGEAVSVAREAGVRNLLLTHFASASRADRVRQCAAAGLPAAAADPGLMLEVTPRAPAGKRPDAGSSDAPAVAGPAGRGWPAV